MHLSFFLLTFSICLQYLSVCLCLSFYRMYRCICVCQSACLSLCILRLNSSFYYLLQHSKVSQGNVIIIHTIEIQIVFLKRPHLKALCALCPLQAVQTKLIQAFSKCLCSNLAGQSGFVPNTAVIAFWGIKRELHFVINWIFFCSAIL